ncbi:MAG: TRAP transporter small permease [Bacteroidota bacterium]
MRKVIDKILERLLVALLSILVLDVLWQVASRYLLSSPSNFTDELAGFLLIWVTLLGAAYATGKKQHLALSLLSTKLSFETNKKLNLLIYGITIVFVVAVMIVGGIWLIYTRFHLGQISAVLQIPIGYVYMILPLSGLFIIYFSIDNAIDEYNSKQLYKEL